MELQPPSWRWVICSKIKGSSLAPYSSLPAHPDPYQRLLSEIARKIRRTLNLEIIWQQTVNSLGKALNISRCLLISYEPRKEQLQVVAEYLTEPFMSMLGTGNLTGIVSLT